MSLPTLTTREVCRIECGHTWNLPLFDKESKRFPVSGQSCARKRESSRVQIEGVRCDTVQWHESAEIHDTCIRPRGCVCGSMFNDGRTRMHTAVIAVSVQLQQQSSSQRVGALSLLGYQWAPQWVPARTPTVHWSPISGKAVGGPNTVQHSSTVQRHGKHFFFGCVRDTS